jgi:hypothetical protein
VHQLGRLGRLVLRLRLHRFGLVHLGCRICHHGHHGRRLHLVGHGRHQFRGFLNSSGFAPVGQGCARVNGAPCHVAIPSACSQARGAHIGGDALPCHQRAPLGIASSLKPADVLCKR